MKKAIIDGNLDEVKRINEFNIERIKLNDPYNCFDVFDINNNLIYFYNTHLIADINSAASCGHLNIVKYFIENGYDNASKSLSNITFSKYWIYLQEPNVNVITNAAKNGHLHIVKYLYETCYKNCDRLVDKDTINSAASNGHLDIIKYLFKNNVFINKKAIKFAAINKHIQIVDFLVFSGVPYNNKDINIEKYKNIYLSLLNKIIIPELNNIIVSYLI